MCCKLLFLRMRKIQNLFFWGFLGLLLASCENINLYERQVRIPSQEWYYNFSPEFTFDIEDTAARYNIYIVLRHTDMYNYNNVWLKVGMQPPGDTFQYKKINFKLATSRAWEGTGMDDIFEVRKIISAGPTQLRKPGKYTFSVSQVMRENPLKHIMNVGLRVEKLPVQE